MRLRAWLLQGPGSQRRDLRSRARFRRAGPPRQRRASGSASRNLCRIRSRCRADGQIRSIRPHRLLPRSVVAPTLRATKGGTSAPRRRTTPSQNMGGELMFHRFLAVMYRLRRDPRDSRPDASAVNHLRERPAIPSEADRSASIYTGSVRFGALCSRRKTAVCNEITIPFQGLPGRPSGYFARCARVSGSESGASHDLLKSRYFEL